MSEVAVGAVDEKQAQPLASDRIHVEITADISITASIARRLVNTQLMLKVGQMIVAGEPELVTEGQTVYWKVPLWVAPPAHDPNIYPTGKYALVDAVLGTYMLSKQEIEELKAAARPLLYQLYPDLPEWMEKIRAAKR